jgi:hypothetical protein
LGLVKIGYAFGKVGVQNTPCTPVGPDWPMHCLQQNEVGVYQCECHTWQCTEVVTFHV